MKNNIIHFICNYNLSSNVESKLFEFINSLNIIPKSNRLSLTHNIIAIGELKISNVAQKIKDKSFVLFQDETTDLR